MKKPKSIPSVLKGKEKGKEKVPAGLVKVNKVVGPGDDG